MNHNLNNEEKELLDSYENDEWVSIKEIEDIDKYKTIAKNTFKKDKRVNIRISEVDLELLQRGKLEKSRGQDQCQ